MKRFFMLLFAMVMIPYVTTLAWTGRIRTDVGESIPTEEFLVGMVAAEIQADMILLAKNIDGVYSADPKKDPGAVKYDAISYDQVLADHLQVMDLTATSLALENHIPVMIFALADPQNILRAVMGERIGTIVEEETKS